MTERVDVLGIDLTDPEADSDSIVYFVRCDRFVKIGVTKNMHGRLRVIKTSNPFKVTLMASIFGGEALESRLHFAFAHLHERGEWFRLNEQLEQFIAHCARVHEQQELDRSLAYVQKNGLPW